MQSEGKTKKVILQRITTQWLIYKVLLINSWSTFPLEEHWENLNTTDELNKFQIDKLATALDHSHERKEACFIHLLILKGIQYLEISYSFGVIKINIRQSCILEH